MNKLENLNLFPQKTEEASLETNQTIETDQTINTDQVIDTDQTIKTDQTIESQTIAPQVEFNPAEELEKISSLPHDERRQAFETWQEQFRRQRVALADMQVEMFKLAKADNNIEPEKLLSILEQYSSKYNFTSEQNNLAKTAIEIFWEKHQGTRCLRSEYPDDKELFLKLFGNRPLGKIKIKEELLSLFVACSNTVDFSQVTNVGRGVLSKIKFILKRYLFLGPNKIGFMTSIPIPGIKGDIIAQDLSRKELVNVFDHEEEHTLWGLVAEAYSRINTSAELTNSELTDSELTDSDEENSSEEDLLSDSVSIIYANIENEFLAHLAEKLSPKKSEESLVLLYINDLINSEIRNLNIGLIDAQDNTADDSAKEIQEKKINGIIEYLKKEDFFDKLLDDLYRGRRAVEQLFKKHYSRAEILALLSHEVLTDWPKLAARLAVKLPEPEHNL